MELVLDLFVTALIALLFSFLIAKLVALSTTSSDHKNVDENISTLDVHTGSVSEEELKSHDKLDRAEFTREPVESIVEEAIADREVVESVNYEVVRESESEENLNFSEVENLLEKRESEEKLNSGNGVTEAEGDSEEVKGDSSLSSKEIGVCSSEVSEKEGKEDESNLKEIEIGEKEKKVEVEIEDDDWEGIERSELEERFARAAKFVEGSDKDGKLVSMGVGNDVQMDLYGLHKVVTEGPCRQQAPMALKVNARAKCDGGQWLHCARNAWQRLGNMSPEVAMERYISLISDNVPGWKEEESTKADEPMSSSATNSGNLAADAVPPVPQPNLNDEKYPGLEHKTVETNLDGVSNVEINKANEE